MKIPASDLRVEASFSITLNRKRTALAAIVETQPSLKQRKGENSSATALFVHVFTQPGSNRPTGNGRSWRKADIRPNDRVGSVQWGRTGDREVAGFLSEVSAAGTG